MPLEVEINGLASSHLSVVTVHHRCRWARVCYPDLDNEDFLSRLAFPQERRRRTSASTSNVDVMRSGG